MKKLIIIYILSLLYTLNIYAQENKIESLRIAYLTKRLSLSPDEAKLFWPLYDQYKKENQDLRIKYKYALKLEPEELALKSEAEADKIITEIISFKQAQIDLTKRYVIEFNKAISKKKIALLYKAEEDFKKELIKRLQKNGKTKPSIGED